MKLLIPCAFGVESSLKRQLDKLGYPDTKAINGRICVNGDWQDVARLNVCLRCGERVLLCVGEFKAQTFDELFDGIYSIRWEDYLTENAKILIDGKSVKSKLVAIKASGGVVKKAIITRLKDKLHLTADTLSESGERVIVGISVFEDIVTVTLDTSGEGLHKRGYRSLAYTAPIKETVAASMIDNSFYFADKIFADPFCGSGTLPIEACLKALNIAPGINREFDFISWKCVQNGVLDKAKEFALDNEKHDVKPMIYGSDINPKAISIAKYHAKRAGVEKYIKFTVSDMRKFKSVTEYGVMISNLPYGERMGETEELIKLYKDLGSMFRNLPNWNGYFLTGFSEGFERWFGKSAEKKIKLYNANIECVYYCYPSKKPIKN